MVKHDTPIGDPEKHPHPDQHDSRPRAGYGFGLGAHHAAPHLRGPDWMGGSPGRGPGPLIRGVDTTIVRNFEFVVLTIVGRERASRWYWPALLINTPPRGTGQSIGRPPSSSYHAERNPLKHRSLNGSESSCLRSTTQNGTRGFFPGLTGPRLRPAHAGFDAEAGNGRSAHDRPAERTSAPGAFLTRPEFRTSEAHRQLGMSAKTRADPGKRACSNDLPGKQGSGSQRTRRTASAAPAQPPVLASPS